MKESVFYQEAMQEGEEKGLHRAILKFAQHRFGPPDSATRDALLAVHDVDRLDRMVDRVATAESWADLLNTP